MATITASNQITYFKRYRMELDLVAPLPAVPTLADEFAWVSWDESLIEAHAEVKCQCFKDELDGAVFPNLANRAGCERLMRDIANRIGFRPQATWLIAHGDTHVATVQGVGDRYGTGAIQNLGVLPAYRGRGLGLALLLQALHGFRQTGLAKANLEVTAQNETAIRMYRQVGFRFRKSYYRMIEPTTYPLSDPEWML